MAEAESNTSGALFLKHLAKKVFLEDWTTKLVALAITLALWVGITGLSTPTTRRIAEVPLTLSYSNATEITNSPVQAVSIVIGGDRRKVNQITENNLVVSVDLSDVPPGERMVQLGPENVLNLPLGVKVQEIQPNRIVVRLEAVEEKEVPVAVETQGEPAEGFEVYGETVNPARVRVRGPASYIRGLTSVPTDRVDISGREADFFARQVPLNVSNPKAIVPESVVDVGFRIGEQRVERMVSVPVERSGRRAQVVLFGGRSSVEVLTPQDIKVELPENADRPAVTLPDGMEGRVEVRRVKLN